MSFKHKRFPGDPLCPGRARDAFLNDFSFFLSDNHREQCSPDDPWLRARSSLGSCCHVEQVRAPRISQGGQPWRQERRRRSENGSVGFESGGCTDPVTMLETGTGAYLYRGHCEGEAGRLGLCPWGR